MSNLMQKIKGIYAITPNEPINIAHIEALIIQHKISVLQYRHKRRPAVQTDKISNDQMKLNEALALRQLCTKHHTLFIINDDINLALKSNADGVHLGQDDSRIEDVRKQLGEKSIIGASCYNSISKAAQAESQGANYVAFGALFNSTTKPDAPICELDIISKAKQQISIPIVGIGGIDFNNQQKVFDAGCDAVAMINALFRPAKE